jgi:hypothetical protein
MGSDCGPDRHLTPANKRVKNLKLLVCAVAMGAVSAEGRHHE